MEIKGDVKYIMMIISWNYETKHWKRDGRSTLPSFNCREYCMGNLLTRKVKWSELNERKIYFLVCVLLTKSFAGGVMYSAKKCFSVEKLKLWVLRLFLVIEYQRKVPARKLIFHLFHATKPDHVFRFRICHW